MIIARPTGYPEHGIVRAMFDDQGEIVYHPSISDSLLIEIWDPGTRTTQRKIFYTSICDISTRTFH